MKELLRTNDRVFLSWADAMLRAEDVAVFVLDGNMSVLEGSANAIPVRLMVAAEDYDRACLIMKEAGEGERLV